MPKEIKSLGWTQYLPKRAKRLDDSRSEDRTVICQSSGEVGPPFVTSDATVILGKLMLESSSSLTMRSECMSPSPGFEAWSSRHVTTSSLAHSAERLTIGRGSQRLGVRWINQTSPCSLSPHGLQILRQ